MEEEGDKYQERSNKATSISISIETTPGSRVIEESKQSIDSLKNQENSSGPKLGMASGLNVGSLYKAWADISRINYFSSKPSTFLLQRSQILRNGTEYLAEDIAAMKAREKSVEDIIVEEFPAKMTQLLNESNYWGCFYCFPELYADVYSPVVRVRNIEDVPEQLGGVLTRDIVTTCLTYLKRTPILGDLVYIKLDLSSKFLKNIQVLQHYKYLVYLDLSSNLLTELKVLSYLLYLQYLSVAFNRLNTVLEYDTPQWFLTEVHYKYNSVKRIADLSLFWSITVLDLSHNNITAITGLETLNYLRRLDLSFNHIQRLENLNHLRLFWLDVSYNNISSYEFGANAGLWTLLHLEFLNLNENNLTSIKMFSGCTRLRELHVRNNRLGMLLELAVYMRQMRRLIILDLRANPLCSMAGYKDVVINTFPLLMSLDAVELDPVTQRTSKMDTAPNVNTFAIRRLLRLIYVEQLSRARVAPNVPPADTTEIPLVVLVGYEGVGKGTLARRLAAECSQHVELAVSHTTAPYHYSGHYKEISRGKFDEMLLAGEFLTYSEMDGESYGLSREEAFIKPEKVRIVCMDLIGALMLKFRGKRPYLILATRVDKVELAMRQNIRKTYRNAAKDTCKSNEGPLERSTLQVLLSGRILVTGIINEIIMYLEDEKEQSEFVVDSECSLMMDSDARARAARDSKGIDLLFFSSATSLIEGTKQIQETTHLEPSLYSLYKSSANGEYNSYLNEKISTQDKKSAKKSDIHMSERGQTTSDGVRPKSVDFSRYASSTWKGLSGANLPESAKSSKSVTFTSADAVGEVDPTGLLIEPPVEEVNVNQAQMSGERGKILRSISARLRQHQNQRQDNDDSDLWLAFLTDTGVVDRTSDQFTPPALSKQVSPHYATMDDPNLILHQLNAYKKMNVTPYNIFATTNKKDDYEEIHRQLPGTFRDTVTMDDPDIAFHKVKNIIKSLFIEQKILKPMFDIDFAELKNYPTVQKRLNKIRKQISPHQMFY